MTARLSEAELSRWLPVSFDDVSDPVATPEPSKGALIQLDDGSYVVVYYGLDSHQLTLEVAEAAADPSALVASFLGEAAIPPARVLWHRADVTLPRPRAQRSAHTVGVRSKRD